MSRDSRYDFAVPHLNTDVLAVIAANLEDRADGDPSTLAELRDLQPAAVQTLEAEFSDRVESTHKIAVPGWPSVGPVDVIVREAAGSETVDLAMELKWCSRSRDVLYEAIWDIFKIALTTTREDRPTGYLLTGAPRGLWQTSEFSDLFENGLHSSRGLASVAFPTRDGRWHGTICCGVATTIIPARCQHVLKPSRRGACLSGPGSYARRKSKFRTANG
jgi:hypothetical protein